MAAHDSPQDTGPSFYLPSVDISPFLQDPTSKAAEQVVSDIRTACLSTGFFQLLGHGVSKDLQTRLFKASAKFFALPLDVRVRLDRLKALGMRGYEAMGVQSYEKDVLGDKKESFVVGTNMEANHPQVVARRFFAGSNQWPTPEELAYHEFRDIVMEYYDKVMELCNVVLDIIAATLSYGPHIFDEFKDNEPACPLRLLHYPPTPAQVAGSKRQLGSSAHTDFGAITLLLQDRNAGLEVLDYNTNEWVDVPPNEEAFVVNIGDMMSQMTGGLYKSSMHRVINKASVDRYSAAFFHDGNVNYRLRDLGKPGAETANVDSALTAEGYMRQRVAATYGIKT